MELTAAHRRAEGLRREVAREELPVVEASRQEMRAAAEGGEMGGGAWECEFLGHMICVLIKISMGVLV